MSHPSSKLSALRLYFPLSAKARTTRFWHRFTAPTLAHHLMSCARRDGIHQAILHAVQSGYLPGDRMQHHHAEIAPMRLPQCIELIDSEQRLRRFLKDHVAELAHVKAMLFPCEPVTE